MTDATTLNQARALLGRIRRVFAQHAPARETLQSETFGAKKKALRAMSKLRPITLRRYLKPSYPADQDILLLMLPGLEHERWAEFQAGAMRAIDRAPLRETPLDKLVGTQPFVDEDILEHFLRHPKKIERATTDILGREETDFPAVMELEGKLYVLEGHHRCQAAILLGRETILAHRFKFEDLERELVKGNQADGYREVFADKRGTGRPGRKPPAIAAVNAYQSELERIYADWSEQTAQDLEEADAEERDSILTAAVANLLALLKRAAGKSLPGAVTTGLGDAPHSADVARQLAEAIEANESYLDDSLGPDILAKVRDGLTDSDILAALAAGAGVVALAGLLASFDGRVASYAGAWWALYNQTVGETADDAGQSVYWQLDPSVTNHCPSCLEFGDHEYASYAALLSETGGVLPASGTDCGSGCRCELIFGGQGNAG